MATTMAPVGPAILRTSSVARFADPDANAPAGIHTITGARDVGAGVGVQMFNIRQSSAPKTKRLPLTCGHIGGAVVAFSVLGIQARGGCGGFQRRSPTGGAANGIPRKAHAP